MRSLSSGVRLRHELDQSRAHLEPHVPAFAPTCPHDPAHLAAPLRRAPGAGCVDVAREGIAAVVSRHADPATIGHLRRIFADYDQGLSLRALGRALEADGMLPPYHARTGSTTWQASSLRGILSDRVYIDEGEAFRTESLKVLDCATGTRVIQRRSRPVEERVSLPAGAAPTVIDPAQFARVQARLQGNQSKATDFRTERNPEVGLLRRGLAYCGQCGNRLVVVTSRGVPSYRCEGRERTGCPLAVTIPVAQVDDAVWDWLTAVLSDEDRVRWHLDSLRRDDPTEFDLASIDRQLHELERQQAKFVAVIERMEDPESAGQIAAKLGTHGRSSRRMPSDCGRHDTSDCMGRSTINLPNAQSPL